MSPKSTAQMRVKLDVEAVKLGKAGIAEGHWVCHVSLFLFQAGVFSGVSGSYSPATSRRRSSLPTGDFGMSRTKT